MSQRFVAIIDADLNLAQHLQAELQRHRLTVEVAADSNELMARKDGLPELVVLCIDPKRTGWAVCNRLRKSPLLKTVPLIITSAEATEKDFDDHKKLKTRAEEYLHKPFSAEALVEKIATLIGLPEPEAGEVEGEVDIGEIELEAEEISAVDIEAEELAVEPEIAPEEEMTLGGSIDSPNGAEPLPADEENTRIGFTAEIDGEVDLETNAAFAAIGLDEPAESAAREAQGGSPFDDDPFGLPDPPPTEHEHAPAPLPAASVSDAVSAAPIHPAPADMDSAPVPRVAAEELDLGLDEVARDAAALVASTPSPRPAAAGNTAGLDEARREVERLKKENEELRARSKGDAAPAAASSFSREREFLTLRETINKKEKEVLDLRDSLDSKERQVLDSKDKIRDAERKLRELDEKTLVTERELVAAREKVEALTSDKERAVEREKQTKGRLEDTQKAVQRFEQEVEQWRTRHTTDTAAVEEKLQQTIAKHREDMGALRQVNAESLADLKTEHDKVLAAERQAHAAEKQTLGQEHEGRHAALIESHAQAVAQKAAEHKAQLEGEVRAAERRHAEAIVDLEGKHEAATRAAAAQQQEALRAQSDEHKRNLEQAIADQLAERARLEADHVRAIEALDAAKHDALTQAAAQAAEALAAAVAQRGQEADAEMKSARDQHARKLQALEESHEDLRAGMLSRHNAATEELKKQHAATIAEYDAGLAERDQIIGQQREQQAQTDAALQAAQEQARTQGQLINDLSGQLESARTELDARAQTVEDRNRRIAELEQESARYQDQILRAYQRIKADESIVARAKKALAIALTLLEESDTEGGEEGAAS